MSLQLTCRVPDRCTNHLRLLSVQTGVEGKILDTLLGFAEPGKVKSLGMRNVFSGFNLTSLISGAFMRVHRVFVDLH